MRVCSWPRPNNPHLRASAFVCGSTSSPTWSSRSKKPTILNLRASAFIRGSHPSASGGRPCASVPGPAPTIPICVHRRSSAVQLHRRLGRAGQKNQQSSSACIRVHLRFTPLRIWRASMRECSWPRPNNPHLRASAFIRSSITPSQRSLSAQDPTLHLHRWSFPILVGTDQPERTEHGGR